jgi:hypothetical protein
MGERAVYTKWVGEAEIERQPKQEAVTGKKQNGGGGGYTWTHGHMETHSG